MKSILIAFFLIISISFSQNSKKDLFAPVIDSLYLRGVDSAFIEKLINHPSLEYDEKYSKINVIPKPGKADYSNHYNDRSVNKSKTFLNENDSLLSLAESDYGVPKEIIASILWVETRHGGYLGNHHVVSVYMNTALAATQEKMDKNRKTVEEYYKDDAESKKKYLDKLESRSEYKANWAINQLVALWKIEPILPISIFDIEGSWAGAFGMSQFLPESYLKWSVDGNGDNKIDLFDKEDAVFSVANYLKTNGWGDTKDEQEKAVWHYNHSSAYVNAVLTLADKIKEE